MIAELWQRRETAQEDRDFAMALAGWYGSRTLFTADCVPNRPALQRRAIVGWQDRQCVVRETGGLFRPNLRHAEDVLADAEDALWAEMERQNITWLEARDIATAA